MPPEPVLCPQCNRPMKRHNKKQGYYELYICPGRCRTWDGGRVKRFVERDDGIDRSCVRFSDCAVAGELHCRECPDSKYSDQVTIRHDREGANSPVPSHLGNKGHHG